MKLTFDVEISGWDIQNFDNKVRVWIKFNSPSTNSFSEENYFDTIDEAVTYLKSRVGKV